MRNICGLVSGNLKRHLVTHRIFADLLFGEDLISAALSGYCDMCDRHIAALREEMEKI